MSGNHNMYCSGNQPDIVQRLRVKKPFHGDIQEAASDIEKLREQLDRAVMRCEHFDAQSEQLAAVTKERDELKQSDTYWRDAYNDSLGREMNLNDGLEAVFADIEVITPNRDYSQMSPKDCYELGLMDGAMAVRNNARAALAKLGADKTGEK